MEQKEYTHTQYFINKKENKYNKKNSPIFANNNNGNFYKFL